VSAWSGLATAIKMVTSFVSIKIVSRIIGPPGMALVGQFLNSITIISALGTGCIGQGVTKYIAEYYDEPKKQQSVIGNALRITLVCTVLVSAVTILASGYLGPYIFHTHKYNSLIVLFGFTIGLYTFNTLIIQILNGFKAFRKYVMANVTASIVGLVLSVVLVLYFGLYGALLNCILAQSVVLGVTLFFVYREPWFRTMFRKTNFDKTVVRKLGGFTLMLLTTSLLVPYAQIVVRNYLTVHISLADAGLWEAMNRISSMSLLLITTSISTYYLPRLSEIRETALLRYEIIKTMKLVLPLFALACLMLYIVRNVVIRILFTPDFLPMQNLFAYQMIGDFFKIASWMLAYLFWAKAMTKHYIIIEATFNLLYIFLATQCVRMFGIQGAVMGYAVNYILYFILLVLLFRSLLKRK
jgi:O-antigen/teichoic acid export membrane protein